MYLTNQECEEIYQECVTAGSCACGSGDIASFTPENMRGLFTAGSGGGYGLSSKGGKKDSEKKDPMYSGTGIVYAKPRTISLKEAFDDIKELSKLKEEKAKVYVDWAMKKIMAEISEGKDNAFYKEQNGIRAEQFAKLASQLTKNGEPLEYFKNEKSERISEDEFREEAISLFIERGVKKHIAEYVVKDYIEQIKDFMKKVNKS